MSNTILEIRNLRTEFLMPNKRHLVAVRDSSLHVDAGEIVGIVGESGCGKSITAYSILRIVPEPGRITAGEILFRGEDLLGKGPEELREIRGKEITLICQDPLSSLNPVYDIFWHFNEIFTAHGVRKSRAEKIEQIVGLLGMVGIVEPERKLHQYPHQFSGGMRQRVVIAMAMLLQPKLIIADVPTTALDVTTQRAIFDLLGGLRDKLGISMIVISHDLYLIAEQCDRMYVMYGGEIMESGRASDVFNHPLHPYSAGLMDSIPSLSFHQEHLNGIKGKFSSVFEENPKGCCFAGRCDRVGEECLLTRPEMREIEEGRFVRCLKA